jgi:hypothetical protein
MRARGASRKSALACRTGSTIKFSQIWEARDKFLAPVTVPEARSTAFIERAYRYGIEVTPKKLGNCCPNFIVKWKTRQFAMRTTFEKGL